ncbi:hypothetical protein [Nannocystis pusilla]|uniref:hypothetical protein n=1 Tax=Nannocystis pusilla TaxID=889268 RepID=UPI003B7F5D89
MVREILNEVRPKPSELFCPGGVRAARAENNGATISDFVASIKRRPTWCTQTEPYGTCGQSGAHGRLRRVVARSAGTRV